MRTTTPVRARPFYGHGMTTVSHAVREHDLFASASEEDAARQFHLRCMAIKGFLNGSRPCPELLDAELDSGSLLGADEFDMDQMTDGIYRRVA